MHDEIFKYPAVIARYRAGPYVEARECFLRNARSEGYAPSVLERMAAVLLATAQATHRNGGQLGSKQLSTTLVSQRKHLLGRAPTAHAAKFMLRTGEAWLRSMDALIVVDNPQGRFAAELHTFADHMRTERGLSPATIAQYLHLLGGFIAALPPRVNSIGKITLDHVEAVLRHDAERGWSRRSLRNLGSCLRSFFRFCAYQGWCDASLAVGIELPRLYDLEDVPRAPSTDDIDRLLATTADSTEAVTIRDHAILLLLIHYGLRRGEVRAAEPRRSRLEGGDDPHPAAQEPWRSDLSAIGAGRQRHPALPARSPSTQRTPLGVPHVPAALPSAVGRRHLHEGALSAEGAGSRTRSHRSPLSATRLCQPVAGGRVHPQADR